MLGNRKPLTRRAAGGKGAFCSRLEYGIDGVPVRRSGYTARREVRQAIAERSRIEESPGPIEQDAG